MSISAVSHWDIPVGLSHQRPCGAGSVGDVHRLKRLACSLLTVILSGQIIGLVQKMGKEPEKKQTPVTEDS